MNKRNNSRSPNRIQAWGKTWPGTRRTTPIDVVLRQQTSATPLKEVTTPPGPDIRPCLAILLEAPLCKMEFPGRGGAVVALTAELLRLGRDRHEIKVSIEDWNRSNVPPLRPQDIERAISAGLTGN